MAAHRVVGLGGGGGGAVGHVHLDANGLELSNLPRDAGGLLRLGAAFDVGLRSAGRSDELQAQA